MNRGHVLRELVLEQLKALIEDGIIQINDKLKYNADKNFTDPLDIPSLGYIQALIEQGGSETLRRTFIIPAGTSAPSGVISLVGLTNEQGDQIIPDKALWAIYDGGRSGGQQYVITNSEVQGLETDENELTVNEVLVVLDGIETTTIALKNDSGVDMLYSINNGQTGSFSANQIIQITPGDSLILSTITQPLDPISLRDQNGYLQNTDGGFDIEQTPHQWIIPNNSTLLFIESGLG